LPVPASEPLNIDKLRGVLAWGLVADIMIARQGQQRRSEAFECCGGERDLSIVDSAIYSEIAVDNNGLRLRGIGEIPRYAPILPKESVRWREVEIREDDNTWHIINPTQGECRVSAPGRNGPKFDNPPGIPAIGDSPINKTGAVLSRASTRRSSEPTIVLQRA
jgi:hypothetical protein